MLPDTGSQLLTTTRKALTINLDPSHYGTFAEIVAGIKAAIDSGRDRGRQCDLLQYLQYRPDPSRGRAHPTHLNRLEGAFLLAGYLGYITWTVIG